MSGNVKKKRKYFSLVWKAVLAVSFATIVASSSVFVLGKFTLEKNFANERARATIVKIVVLFSMLLSL